MNTHHLAIRVYYEDTDAADIVYHANYLRFAERARVEYFRQAGHDITDKSCAFAVVAVNIQYHTSAVLDDQLNIHSTITRVGNSSLDVEQVIDVEGKKICSMKITLVCFNVHQNKTPVPVPDYIRALHRPV